MKRAHVLVLVLSLIAFASGASAQASRNHEAEMAGLLRVLGMDTSLASLGWLAPRQLQGALLIGISRQATECERKSRQQVQKKNCDLKHRNPWVYDLTFRRMNHPIWRFPIEPFFL